jgi:hypothetical protein
MKKTILSLAVALAMMAAGGMTLAHEYKAGDIEVLHPWTRATPPSAPTAGGFLQLRNDGDTADALIGAHSPVAERVEIHTMSVEGGVMRMRPVGEGGVPVNPGETVALAPGGIHIMFMGLKQQFKAGERVPLTLEFKNAGSLDVDLVTEQLGGSQHPGGMGNMKDMKHDMEHSN